MALVVKCDRCGKYITIKENSEPTLQAKNKAYRLCPSCTSYFYDWLKGRKDLGVIKVDIP